MKNPAIDNVPAIKIKIIIFITMSLISKTKYNSPAINTITTMISRNNVITFPFFFGSPGRI